MVHTPKVPLLNKTFTSSKKYKVLVESSGGGLPSSLFLIPNSLRNLGVTFSKSVAILAPYNLFDNLTFLVLVLSQSKVVYGEIIL